MSSNLFSTPRIILSGLASREGKSLISLGLAIVLRKRGHSVSFCVQGSQLEQAVIYKRMLGRNVRSLDQQLLSPKQLGVCFQQAAVGANCIIVDGSRGLYDSMTPGLLRGSDADLAYLTKTPVVLVLDLSRLGQTFAGVVRGFQDVSRTFRVVGVIGNRVPPSLLSQRRKDADVSLDLFELGKLAGCFPYIDGCPSLPDQFPKQGGVAPLLPRQFLIELTALIEEHIDIDRILKEAQRAAPVENLVDDTAISTKVRIAVSDDNSMNLCYQDNLELLKSHGAELVSFSPLADEQLPRGIHGVYFTGGYTRNYGINLSNNQSLKESLVAFVRAGGVLYSEGAGTTLLCDEFPTLNADGQEVMVPGYGILSGTAEYSSERCWNYMEGVTVEETILGKAGIIVKGSDSCEWGLRINKKSTNTAEHSSRLLSTLKITRRGEKSSLSEGFSSGAQIFCTFSFLHWGSNPQIAKAFIEAASVYKS